MPSAEELPAIDAGLIPTQFVSGIRTPHFDGDVWTLEMVEERGGELLIVGRYVLTQAAFLRMAGMAVAPVATAFGLPRPQTRLDA